LLEAVMPDPLESGPAPGQWRRELVEPRRQSGHLFSHILVALDGKVGGWQALNYALELAQREEGRLFGLHVAASEALKEVEHTQILQAEFQQRCQAAGVPGVTSAPKSRKLPRC
jgi:hypothetical protein